jgi:hypothetical protein
VKWLLQMRHLVGMQGHKQFPDRVVLRFRLSERVLQQNLYCLLSEFLDSAFLYQQTQNLLRLLRRTKRED